jgi:hypothetical protein
MVKGIETDKKYKHIKKNDVKWLAKDLNEIRDTFENYIDSNRPSDDENIVKAATIKKKKSMPIIRIIVIVLGIMGIFALLSGIFLIFQDNYVIGIFTSLIGVVFIISFILFEKYG